MSEREVIAQFGKGDPVSVSTELAYEATSVHDEDGTRLPRGVSQSGAQTTIERATTVRLVDFAELWRHRELFYFLIWRDLKVRYRQTVLGVAWAILQPFATMVVFSLFLGRAIQSAEGSIPYPLYVFAGLLPWFYFANAITAASQSIVGNQSLVTKIYFPRMLIPLVAVGVGAVDYVIGVAMLALLMAFYGVAPAWGLLALPFVFLVLTIAAIGVGTLLAALTVAYRDVRHAVPFLVQLWMFATPTIYVKADASMSAGWHLILALNPAYGLIANMRAAALGGAFDVLGLLVSGGVSLLLLGGGCYYFRRVERSFADIV